MGPMWRYIILAAVIVAAPARAGLDDYKSAREALERNEVLPLATILEMVEGEIDARIIEVEFEQREGDGAYIYEFELITPNGRLLEMIADAVSGEILSVGEDEED
jgi:uncharacterized membrane protein YkoI